MTAQTLAANEKTRTGDPRRIVFGAAVLAIFMASVEATIVSTAMPTIVADLGGLRFFSWVFGLYFLMQAVTIPFYGRLSDVYGRKPLITAAIGLFLVSSIACGFARSMPLLIAFRALQGLGAGGIQPLATTIVGDIYTAAERARYQGYLSSTWGVSAVAGPLLGAFLLQHFTWSAIFWINVPIGISCALALWLFYRETIHRRPHHIDVLGSILLIVGMGALMSALLIGEDAGALAGVLLGVTSAVALVLLVLHELRTPEPLIPVRYWANRVIAIGNAGSCVIGMTIMGVSVFLPTYVQGAMGQPAIVAGITVGTQSVFWTLGSLVSGRVMLRTSYRTAAAVGAAVLVCGTGIMVAMQPWRGPWWAGVGTAVMGLGIGMANIVFLISTQGAVSREERGTATASNLFMRNFGQTVGTALLGAVFNLGLGHIPNASATIARLINGGARTPAEHGLLARYAGAIAGSIHNVYLLCGLLAVTMLVLTLVFPARLSPTRSGSA